MSLQLAEQFEANEQYEQALEEYRKEFEKNSDDVGLLERLGHLSLILDKSDDAANYYYEILQRDPANTLAYEQLMSIYEQTDKFKYYIYRGNKNSIEGKFEFAINDMKKALAHAVENETQILMTRLTIANLYLQTGNRMKAIDEFNLILEMEEVREEIFLQLANVYVEDEIYASAIDTLNRAIEKGFDTPSIREALAAVYFKSGDLDNAIANTQDDLLKVQSLIEQGNNEQALVILDSLSEVDRQNPRYYSLQAQYYYSIKDYTKSLEFVDEFNKIQPNSPLTYQMRALIYEDLNDDYNAHVNWARYQMLRGNKDIAINEFLNAVQLNSSDVNVMFTLADLLTENGDINHASEYFEKIIKVDSKNKEALKKLADYRESIGDYRAQVDYLERIYDLDEKDLVNLKNLAHGYEKNNSKQNAIGAYKKYLEYETDAVEIKKVQDRLNKLQNTVGDGEESVGLIDKIMALFNK